LCSSRSSTSLSKQSNRSGGSSGASGKTSSTGASSRGAAARKLTPDVILGLGMSVFVNKEMGVVRYLGKTDFEEGLWLGVELRKPGG